MIYSNLRRFRGVIRRPVRTGLSLLYREYGIIARIGFFGKEHYQVKLKNGTPLKVILSGYKVLKR
ncbi:hypothetical protein [Tannerella forsythia]|uniref:hypothetical protein n=1 Tax=Tannerella forsythia TaxID=28112 RepID=UPI0028E4C2D2|nr:hypothetical protein [Tannerella forsythia]